MIHNIGYTHRTICAVLEEIRKAYETRNFSYIPGLVEEAQTYANRMESKLWDQNEYDRAKYKYKKLKKKIKELESKDEQEVQVISVKEDDD